MALSKSIIQKAEGKEPAAMLDEINRFLEEFPDLLRQLEGMVDAYSINPESCKMLGVDSYPQQAADIVKIGYCSMLQLYEKLKNENQRKIL